MFFKLAQLFKTWFIALVLIEIKAQSKRIRKSNDKVSAAFEAAERFAADQDEKRRLSGQRIDAAIQLKEL